MFVIGETVIDEAVIQSSFCCDLEKCKGACCCIEGGRGAPLENDEVVEIEKAYPVVREYLSRKSIQTMRAQVFTMVPPETLRLLVSINENSCSLFSKTASQGAALRELSRKGR